MEVRFVCGGDYWGVDFVCFGYRCYLKSDCDSVELDSESVRLSFPVVNLVLLLVCSLVKVGTRSCVHRK
jgi:hypothetical protein